MLRRPVRAPPVGQFRFAVADHFERCGEDAHLYQIVFGFGAFVTKGQVVFVGAAFVAMALDGQLVVWVVLQDVAEFRRFLCSAVRV